MKLLKTGHFFQNTLLYIVDLDANMNNNNIFSEFFDMAGLRVSMLK